MANDPQGETKGGKVELLITLCRFRAGKEGEDRLGTCSRFVLQELRQGASVACYHHQSLVFRVGLTPEVPLVMVANGSGIAPMRYMCGIYPDSVLLGLQNFLS